MLSISSIQFATSDVGRWLRT